MSVLPQVVCAPFDPEEQRGDLKIDCIIPDFGTSGLAPGTLAPDIDLDGRDPVLGTGTI
ncbi:hypothetical protein JHW45_07220 [Paracoccus stylophorae]|uniref:Uncharacterized protein n=1 Tax=Paracoccus stylophorae TaxID=659350 RepID=A0ABY7T0L0_9RHOB|nr:hypothetical protein [Paracoccus stylophorae]WCR12117.1 hypothetical protein JHW45_07220 [Paracoccus stylophorae]